MHLVFITFALFASVFTVGKVALLQAPPFFLTGIRYLLAGGILCLYEAYKGRLKQHSPIPHLPTLIAIGVFSVFLTNGLEFWGMQYLTSGKTCLFYSMSPFYSILLAYVSLGETMTKRKWIGLLIGLFGFAILIFSEDLSDQAEGLWKMGNFSIAEIAVSISALTAVIGWIYFKKLVNLKGYPINLANAYSFIVGGIFGLITSLFCESLPEWEYDYDSFTLLWQIAYITIVHSIICYTLYAHALRKFSVTFMFFAGITNPMFTALYGWLFINESVGYEFALCILLVSVGLYLFYLEEQAKTES